MGVLHNFANAFKRNRALWRTDVAIIGFFLLMMVAFAFFGKYFPGRDEVETWTSQFGGGGPFVVMAIIIAETVIAPIPGGVVVIALGILYGVWPGILYAWVGNMIGSTLAFWISRKFGRPIVGRLVKKEQLSLYDAFLGRNELMMWLVYLLPAFPVDVASFAIGLSTISFRRFLKIISIGFLSTGLILTTYGQKLLEVSEGVRLIYLAVAMFAVIIAVTLPKFIVTKRSK